MRRMGRVRSTLRGTRQALDAASGDGAFRGCIHRRPIGEPDRDERIGIQEVGSAMIAMRAEHHAAHAGSAPGFSACT